MKLKMYDFLFNLLALLDQFFSGFIVGFRYKTAPEIDEERKTLLKLDSN